MLSNKDNVIKELILVMAYILVISFLKGSLYVTSACSIYGLAKVVCGLIELGTFEEMIMS